jgi:hypothetical protein
MDYLWGEVKDAVNHVYKKYNQHLKNIDIVKELLNNTISYGIEKALVFEMINYNRDKYTEIIINGYNQIQAKGYIKSNPTNVI